MTEQYHEIIVCYSLIDITRTGVVGTYRSNSAENFSIWNYRRNQQRNWETMVQLIGLRAQPMYLTDPVVLDDRDLSEHKFCKAFYGKHKIWTFEFASEHTQVYGDDLSLLDQDVHNIPVNINLDESAEFETPIFDTMANRNTYFILKYR